MKDTEKNIPIFMKAKIIIPKFEQLVAAAPKEIQDIVERSKKTNQGKIWHPEGVVYIHLKIVYNRAARTNDINLAMAAFFHDLGKVETTIFKPPEKWSAHGHEFVSARLVDKYRTWIESYGADYDIVHYVVIQHMRAKNLHEFRPKKREAFMSHPLYHYVNEFTKFDDMQTDFSNDIDD